MDQSQRQLEAQVDLKRLQKARKKAQKKNPPKPLIKKPTLPRKRGM